MNESNPARAAARTPTGRLFYNGHFYTGPGYAASVLWAQGGRIRALGGPEGERGFSAAQAGSKVWLTWRSRSVMGRCWGQMASHRRHWTQSDALPWPWTLRE